MHCFVYYFILELILKGCIGWGAPSEKDFYYRLTQNASSLFDDRLEKFNVNVNVLLFTLLLLLIRSGIGSVMLDIFRFKGFMFTSGVRYLLCLDNEFL